VAARPSDISLATTRMSHALKTGEDVTDVKRLAELARQNETGASADGEQLMQRSVMMAALSKKRAELGIARPGTVFERVVADSGLHLITRARMFYASNPHVPCERDWMADEAACLMPYSLPMFKGTCDELDKLTCQNALNYNLQTRGGAEEQADAMDEIEEERGYEGYEMDATGED
jgi:hypothetical protein